MDTEQLKLEEGESVISAVRKHWFILLSKTFGICVTGVVPLFITVFLLSNTHTIGFVSEPALLYKPAAFFCVVWILFMWMMFFGVWTNYYLDMWIITNRRVIAIDQKGFFRRSVASFRFERLQDITVEIDGFIPTLLDFGTVRAETAGHSESFIVDDIPHPRDIKALIQEHADQVISVTINPNNSTAL